MKWTGKDIKLLIELYQAFVSVSDIAEQLGRSVGSVKAKIRAMKLKRDKITAEDINVEIKLLRVKEEMRRLKKMKRAIIAEKIREERVIDALKESIPAFKNVKMIKFPTVINKPRTKEQAVLAIGDVHAGEKVSAVEMGGINEYNMAILEERIKKLISTSLDLAFVKLQGYEFTKLNVILLGDMVSGIIHDELTKTMDGSIMDVLFETAHMLAQAIRELKKYYPKIHVTAVYGNHGRLSEKVTFKRRFENWDYIMYRIIELALKDVSDITFNIPRSFWTVENLNGHRMLVLHGNNIRGWNGIPYYGINRALANFEQVLAAKDQHFDSAILGHFHQRASLPRINGEVLVNGSVVGADEFALGALWSAAGPSQLFFGVNPKQGITWRFPIKL